jgi:DNA primase
MRAEQIKAKISPIQFYEKELSINSHKSSDWCPAGLCPFHNDQHKGNFFINTKTGAFKCFACDAKGQDIIAFAMRAWSQDFPTTIKILQKEFIK